MKFRKLTLENFRPYYGLNELKFDLSDEKNIIIVEGNNGHGKTSILRAIEWVFYGSTPRERYNLYNRIAREENGSISKVELSFLHGSENFRLIRTLKPSDYPIKKGTSISESVELYKGSEVLDRDGVQ